MEKKAGLYTTYSAINVCAWFCWHCYIPIAITNTDKSSVKLNKMLLKMRDKSRRLTLVQSGHQLRLCEYRGCIPQHLYMHMPGGGLVQSK